jgi:hypothetical protein
MNTRSTAGSSAARAAAAAKHIDDARQQLARGKFQKARALVSTAAALNPDNSQHKLVLASIEEEERRLSAEDDRRRQAKQRARAVAPILDRARAAEAQAEYERAAWTAENALALDPDSVNLTLGVLLKYQDDIAKVQGSEAARLLAEVKKAAQEPA